MSDRPNRRAIRPTSVRGLAVLGLLALTSCAGQATAVDRGADAPAPQHDAHDAPGGAEPLWVDAVESMGQMADLATTVVVARPTATPEIEVAADGSSRIVGQQFIVVEKITGDPLAVHDRIVVTRWQPSGAGGGGSHGTQGPFTADAYVLGLVAAPEYGDGHWATVGGSSSVVALENDGTIPAGARVATDGASELSKAIAGQPLDEVERDIVGQD
jgi:hypothetical protein